MKKFILIALVLGLAAVAVAQVSLKQAAKNAVVAAIQSKSTPLGKLKMAVEIEDWLKLYRSKITARYEVEAVIDANPTMPIGTKTWLRTHADDKTAEVANEGELIPVEGEGEVI